MGKHESNIDGRENDLIRCEMSTTKEKRCKKHEGISVYFVAGKGKCPICLMNQKINALELKVRFFVGFINWSMDFLKIVSYDGPDKVERQSDIDAICSKINDPKMSMEQIVLLLEDYGELREGFTWN